MENLSVFVTTFNNARTLAPCLESVKWADEIVLLDSFSTDETVSIAERYGCRIFQHEFLGYGRQKQMALEHTRNRWVLLLDADEALAPDLQAEIRALLERGPQADGYEIPRQEQLFWRMCSPRVRMNHFLRLFDKHKGHVTDMPVHAAPKVDGTIHRLRNPFYHFGETDIHTKVDKINHYSTGLVADKLGKGRGRHPWILVLYPPVYFLRSYVFKRNFLNGWAGFITSVTGAFYVFLKYAKVYEERQFQRHGERLMPPGAPASPRDSRAQRY
ncbi:MAG: glycosyltransferase family 2 protein [Gammaproteobacteria bacterium]